MNNTSINSNLEEAFKNSDWSSICAALMPHFNDYLARRSKNVFECEQVNTLDHVFTVPALYDDLAGTRKQVIVPMKVFTRDIDAELVEAKKATAAANTAAETANTAAANADRAREGLDAKKTEVDEAVSASKTATEAAKKATTDTISSKTAIEKNESARQSAEAARDKAETERATNEAARVEVEKKRVTAENARATAETARANSETTRNSNESTRKNQETTRQTQEAARVEAEKKRVAAENGRATAESGRVKAETKRETDTKAAIASSKTQTDLAQELNAHPQKQGDNGNWWQWNTKTHAYEDTGIVARGGAMYPTFKHVGNKLYIVDYGSNVSERVVKKGNKLVFRI